MRIPLRSHVAVAWTLVASLAPLAAFAGPPQAPDRPLDTGFYFRLTTRWQGEGKSLDVVNDGAGNDRPILAASGNFSGQLWRLTPVGNGLYRLTTQWQGEGKALQVVEGGGPEGRLLLAPPAARGERLWRITPVGQGFHRLTTRWRGEVRSLDIANDGVGNDRPILARTGDFSGQHWKLTRTEVSIAPPPLPPSPRPDPGVAPAGQQCASSDECVVFCPSAPGCCDSAPCGCKRAVNRREVPSIQEAFAARCDRGTCPVYACAYQPALFAACENGRCVARGGP